VSMTLHRVWTLSCPHIRALACFVNDHSVFMYDKSVKICENTTCLAIVCSHSVFFFFQPMCTEEKWRFSTTCKRPSWIVKRCNCYVCDGENALFGVFVMSTESSLRFDYLKDNRIHLLITFAWSRHCCTLSRVRRAARLTSHQKIRITAAVRIQF
jgi:hypothetical protein